MDSAADPDFFFIPDADFFLSTKDPRSRIQQQKRGEKIKLLFLSFFLDIRFTELVIFWTVSEKDLNQLTKNLNFN